MQTCERLVFVMLVTRQAEGEMLAWFGNGQRAEKLVPDRKQQAVVTIVVPRVNAVVELMPVRAQ